MNRKEIIIFLALKTVGNFLVLFSLFGFFATFGPSVYLELSYRLLRAKGVTYHVASLPEISSHVIKEKKATDSLGFNAILSDSKRDVLIPIDPLFSVLIPKIGANAKVFPNVDPSNEPEYVRLLKHGVAHAKGTVFPGMDGTIYLFAHSTDNFWDVGRYNAVFYLLKDIIVGDDIVLFFQNKRYNYKVVSTKIIEGNDISYLEKAQHTGKEQVILQTCWPPGTTWKRLLVFAQQTKK